MEDPSSAYEDMLFFERRLTEVISGMQPKVRNWRIVLFMLLLSTAYTAYHWISDPDLDSISFRESLAKHPLFTACVTVLMVLFLFFGVHKRVVAPKIIAQRCRYVLGDFCLSCDEHGKLIVRPAYPSTTHSSPHLHHHQQQTQQQQPLSSSHSSATAATTSTTTVAAKTTTTTTFVPP
ncbi:hypothetical protein niasHT_016115 [Heterodera trifolii]|uniref:Transmembrane protein 188 n=1 Tax=Heterodera trifolii TaxID=157864 RepID=A0ABD2L412_9BILA